MTNAEEPRLVEFSADEVAVLMYAMGGMTNKEIGAVIGVSTANVNHHLGRIFTKTRMWSRTGAARYFAERFVAPEVWEKWRATSTVARRFVHALQTLEPREIQVLGFLIANPDYNNQDIAHYMEISEAVVVACLVRIAKKCGVTAHFSRTFLAVVGYATLERTPVVRHES